MSKEEHGIKLSKMLNMEPSELDEHDVDVIQALIDEKNDEQWRLILEYFEVERQAFSSFPAIVINQDTIDFYQDDLFFQLPKEECSKAFNALCELISKNYYKILECQNIKCSLSGNCFIKIFMLMDHHLEVSLESNAQLVKM